MKRRRSLILVAALLAAAAAAGVLLYSQVLLPRTGQGAATEQYTCPMPEHADVRSDGPGACPKCGMDLVPISQTEHKGRGPGSPPEAAPAAEEGTEHGAGHEGHETQPAGAAAAKQEAAGPAKPAQGKGKVIYYCPMHPTYTSDRPGDCPICNMTLVPMDEELDAGASGVEGMAAVTIRPERQQLIGVTTGTVERKAVSAAVRAAGRVEYDETRLSAVNLKFGGWVEELYVKTTGERVEKGQPLFAIYSPALFEAQQNYLLALEAWKAHAASAADAMRSSLEQNLRSAKERLLLWDIAEEQIRGLEERKAAENRTAILSKVAGVVTQRNIVLGTYVEPEVNLYEIADLSTVWVLADVYEYEIPSVKVGTEAQVEVSSLPGEPVSGQVTYVYPYLNPATRTVSVRLEVENPEGKLKPAMYATVEIAEDLGEQLVIDEDAVLDSGMRQIAFVVGDEGRFEPREVEVGRRAGGLAVVLAGLAEGEKVVTSGNFLIDSESRLKAALRRGASARDAAAEGPATGGHQH